MRRDEWPALAARITGLKEATKLAATLFSSRSDAVGVFTDLGEHGRWILADLKAFANSLDKIDQNAFNAIQVVVTDAGNLLAQRDATQDLRDIYIRSAIVKIAALEDQVSYLLRDNQQQIASRSERAFAHINRTIMVDGRVQQDWRDAYADREERCEQLGAVHLLLHGIWAFKVNASGGRTDLVYQDALTDLSTVERTGDGLVLTEWKRHLGQPNTARLFEDARKQSSGYAAGVLGGTELKRLRYAVVVSETEIPVPQDVVYKHVTYRHINIVVNPKTPSKRK